jgi:hypothetical protein
MDVIHGRLLSSPLKSASATSMSCWMLRNTSSLMVSSLQTMRLALRES